MSGESKGNDWSDGNVRDSVAKGSGTGARKNRNKMLSTAHSQVKEQYFAALTFVFKGSQDVFARDPALKRAVLATLSGLPPPHLEVLGLICVRDIGASEGLCFRGPCLVLADLCFPSDLKLDSKPIWQEVAGQLERHNELPGAVVMRKPNWPDDDERAVFLERLFVVGTGTGTFQFCIADLSVHNFQKLAHLTSRPHANTVEGVVFEQLLKDGDTKEECFRRMLLDPLLAVGSAQRAAMGFSEHTHSPVEGSDEKPWVLVLRVILDACGGREAFLSAAVQAVLDAAELLPMVGRALAPSCLDLMFVMKVLGILGCTLFLGLDEHNLKVEDHRNLGAHLHHQLEGLLTRAELDGHMADISLLEAP